MLQACAKTVTLRLPALNVTLCSNFCNVKDVTVDFHPKCADFSGDLSVLSNSVVKLNVNGFQDWKGNASSTLQRIVRCFPLLLTLVIERGLWTRSILLKEILDIKCLTRVELYCEAFHLSVLELLVKECPRLKYT